MTDRVLELIFFRPSLTMQTTTFFHPSLPQVLDRSLEHKCAMFFITPCIVRQNNSSSSLYMVRTIKSSVRRGGSYKTWRRVYPSSLKLLGSQVAAEYLIKANSRSVRIAHMSSSLDGTAESRTKLPWNNLQTSLGPSGVIAKLRKHSLDFLDCPITSRNPLWNATVPDVVLLLGVFCWRRGVRSRNPGNSTRALSVQQWNIMSGCSRIVWFIV